GAVEPTERVEAGGELAGDDAADGEPPDVVVVAEVVRLEAHGRVRIVGRPGQRAHHRPEEGPEVRPLHGRVRARGAGARVRVDDGELELRLGRAEVDEEPVEL